MATIRESLNYQPVELGFGTSGLRALASDMTDLECYINTCGFLRFLQQADRLPLHTTIYLAGDLRSSTPRILRAVHAAVEANGCQTVYCGLIPTPALAYYAGLQGAPCIMVTGSHIPEDRNGIKFYKTEGEVLKEDELAIKESVAAVRAEVYASEASAFTPEGTLTQPPTLPVEAPAATQAYCKRYTNVFGGHLLTGKKVVVYQHSAVGRDIMVQILASLGADVVPVGRSKTFVPIDTENVTPDDQAYFHVLAKQHPDAFAIVSTDGDGDRPFVIDQTGLFHRGDVLGAVVADWLDADFAALPISASDAVDTHLAERKVKWQHTKIGSPYVIVVMEEALRAGYTRVVGWEVNGGFLTGNDLTIGGHVLTALATRDAMLPIIGALAAARQAATPLDILFTALPQRFTQAGLINDFATETSQKLVQHFAQDTPQVRTELAAFFTKKLGFGHITRINSLDGIRIYFDNGDIAHMRPSGNAPQLRMYSVAATQKRADDIVQMALAEPDGIFRRMQRDLT